VILGDKLRQVERRVEARLEHVYLESNRLDYVEVNLEVPMSGV